MGNDTKEQRKVKKKIGRNKVTCYKKRIAKRKKKLIKPMKQGVDLCRKKKQHSVSCILGLTNNDSKRIV